ncbi:hypothetical protein Kfla_0739 [Kribbella flavida DSM 17836]|uniref:Uncharacterized protein n=1 Tax=Kribbella flavida (strain DSM 17836 / JCM 10339 / NBRC 14399) TaxID=479435 RepID=D2PYL3_KRIFD|nr:hypothetical protein [Kribbella flavida]ADB29859.1 hypothetical protein Kfla_0739 [Kribbella flavida DSM 17836]
MAVGGVDTYYDYEEKQWKSRRLGGGPIRRGPVCPAPRADHQPAERRTAGHERKGQDEKGQRVLT